MNKKNINEQPCAFSGCLLRHAGLDELQWYRKQQLLELLYLEPQWNENNAQKLEVNGVEMAYKKKKET